MKKYIITTLVVLLSLTSYAQVGIGTTNPNTEAALHIDGDKKSLLLPRMTTTDRDAISNPAEGLVIYNLTENCLNVYVGLGWSSLCSGDISGPVDPSACDNDVSTVVGTGNLVAMDYNYSGDFGVADYTWCAYEITQATEDAKYGSTNAAPLSGKTWLDRNLGAYQYATSSTDKASYGDLYQWGRAMDGHAKRYQRDNDPAENNGTQGNMANSTTSTNADDPSDALFITDSDDWRENPDDNLWSGTGGVNNPCPSGYYVPTETQLQTLEDWLDDDTNRAQRAIQDTDLNMPLTGARDNIDGTFLFIDTQGHLWSSSVNGSNGVVMFWTSSQSNLSGQVGRARGYPVRCVKD